MIVGGGCVIHGGWRPSACLWTLVMALCRIQPYESGETQGGIRSIPLGHD